MAFTRDDLAAYEKQPAKVISDKVSPFRGATPARAADAAAVAAVASGNVDATPGGAPRAQAQAAPADDAPVVDEDGSLGDPTDSGEGTSDAQSDSSTDLVGHGDAADPNADLTGDAPTEGGDEPVPAKGSARERIVELNDNLEGTKIFARSMQETAKTLAEQNAILRAQLDGTSPAAAVPAPRVENDAPGPMPDMSDEDVQFDNDKYREKMAKWSKANARAEARAMFQEMTGATQAQQLVVEVNTKVEAYKQEHPEFEEIVTNNKTLKANQLAPIAGLRVAKSPYTAEILMHFGNDVPYAVRVAKMSPDEQLMEIGEIVAGIKAAKKAAGTNGANPVPRNGQTTRQTGAQPARKSITNAPPPPRPTPAAGRPAARDVLDPNISMDDFVRQHRTGKQADRAQNRKQRGLN
jgi:hypothetical protein